jgi:hypothetical protein
MTTPGPIDIDDIAADYVLGTLPADEHARVTAALKHDHSLRAAVETWERRLLPLAEEIPAAELPDTLWANIEKSLGNGEIPGTVTIHRDEGTWTPILPGIDMKLLHVDTQAGTQSFLLRMAPGSRLPPHDHSAGPEECLVLEGETEVAGVTVRAGDFHLAPQGFRHTEILSRTGAVIYIRNPLAERHR